MPEIKYRMPQEDVRYLLENIKTPDLKKLMATAFKRGFDITDKAWNAETIGDQNKNYEDDIAYINNRDAIIESELQMLLCRMRERNN